MGGEGLPVSLAGVWSVALSTGPLQTLVSSSSLLSPCPGLAMSPPETPPSPTPVCRMGPGPSRSDPPGRHPSPRPPSVWATCKLAPHNSEQCRAEALVTEHTLPVKRFAHLVLLNLRVMSQEAAVSS